MNAIKILVFAVAGVAAIPSVAEGEARATFGKWHVGVGAAFNSGVKARLGVRNLPPAPRYAVPHDKSYGKAADDAANRRWQNGEAFIADDGGMEFDTENWRLPVSAYDKATGTFTFDNPYEEIVGGRDVPVHHDGSGDEMQYGLSVELSRELWIRGENDEHRRGVDFAAAFSYFFRRGIYSARGGVTRVDDVQERSLRTTVTDPSAMWGYDHGECEPVDGMYGYGTGEGYVRTGIRPAIGWENVVAPDPHGIAGAVRKEYSSNGYRASGDYRELEMLFMLRPWYEIEDWWRVYAEVGVGVSWGRFDSTFRGGGVSASEEFTRWDCYGVAGLGTVFRCGHWDLGVDFLGRFLRDDLDVDGKYANGSVERSPWGFRVMAGRSF